MITDAVLALAGWVGTFVAGLLPSDHLTLPPLGGITSAIAKADSLLPVSGILTAALGVLAAVVVFVLIRLTLTVWNLIWP